MARSWAEGNLVAGEPQLGDQVPGDDPADGIVGAAFGQLARMPRQHHGRADDQVLVRHRQAQWRRPVNRCRTFFESYSELRR